MIVHNLSETNSILNKFVAEIRDVAVQKDKLRFRRNIERIGEVLGYELSKQLSFSSEKIKTPLGRKAMAIPINNIVLCSILRAGLPLHQGLLNYFDDVENAFISAYRYHPKQDDAFEIVVEYFATPSLKDKVVLLADSMLATGQSLVAVLEAIQQKGTPKEIHIVAVIGAKEGIDFVAEEFPENTHLWIAAIDEKLNDKGYIVPGLGDAGDLAYGIKL